ncbi:MAG: glycosyltransferase family 4 protein [Planctomycetia bacterium]|nr:glycosyltransferase family 4 protein [Planctomycetia bacterium]
MFVLASPFRDTLLRWGYKGPIKMMTTTTEDSFLDYPRTYDAQKKCYNVLYLSRITKLKGIFPALETVRILQQEMKLNFRFTIAGYGDCVDEVLKKIEELHLQNVDFKGYVAGEKKIETFQEADIFFFPSFIEGMPNVVLEAMALGLPIITTRVGGLPDFFKNNEMGFMVDSVSPQDFANRIAELLNNPSLLETFGKYNREYARNHFRASLVAEKLKGYLV